MTAQMQNMQSAGPALGGETRLVVIVGDPIAQVKSPSLLTANFTARGIDTVVVPGHVRPADFDGFLRGVAAMQNLDGIIATVPHKQAMLTHCTELTDRARFAAASNVMWRVGGGWCGDNTDGMGHVNGIRAAGGTVEGARVLLVGAGGAGSAIAFEFLEQGAAHLAIHDLDTDRRDALIARLEPRFPGRLSAGSDDPSGFDIVSNATPLGMREGDPLPVRGELLTPGHFVADVVTRPAIPPLIAAARDKGCGTMPGSGMFEAQADLLVEALLRSEKQY